MRSDIPCLLLLLRPFLHAATRVPLGPRTLIALALLLLSPAQLPAQPAVDPGAVTLEAIDQLRFAQETFPQVAADLEAVIVRLERSLVDTGGQPLHVDTCHVQPLPGGLDAFIEARQAVIEIGKLLSRPAPPFVARTLVAVRSSVVEAYQLLAEVALQEARALAEDTAAHMQVSQAETELANALGDLAVDAYPKAMQSLRLCWQHAQVALPAEGGDGNGPLLNIQSPLDGALLFESPISVSGMVQLLTTGMVGPEDVTVAVNGIAAAVDNRSFQADGVELREGLNAIVGVAEDDDGDTATACVAVRFDSAPRPRVAAVSGNGQTALIGTRLPQPLVVRVSDAAGSPVADAQVVFRVVQGNGTLGSGERGEVALTGASGEAQADFILGTRAGVGVNRVRATAVGFAGEVIFTATATTTLAASINAVSGDNQNGGLGTTLPLPLTVVVTDSGQNPVVGETVTFEVLAGGGNIGGAAAASVATDGDGRASVSLTLGPEAGLDNNLVEARFAGLTNEPATFKASSFELGDPAATRILGVVLDNQGDPVPGTTLKIHGTAVSAVADAEGQFVLSGVPVGKVLLDADATTVTRPGVWASLQFELHTLPGVDNTLVKPIFILPLDVASGQIAGGDEDVTITVPEVPGFSLTVLAGSATFPDGSPTGLVSVTPVHADKIPMAPGSGMQPRFIVTVQPAGAHFDPPAPVTFPNVDGLAPGTVTEMFSFDHDLGEFVSIGTGTVAEDGMTVSSDPGFGIVKAGWHCSAPQSGSGASATLDVEITTEGPVVLCPGGEGEETKTLSASGAPPRDAEYSWESSDTSIFTVSPSGGGLCPDATTCSTIATGVGPGKGTATVTFTCTTTGASDQDTIEVLVTRVEILRAEICPDVIETRLSPEDAAGTFTLRATGPEGDAGILEEERSGGTYTDNFNFAGLPNQEFTEIEARWDVEGCIQKDTEDAHFKPLGNIRHTQYNCPSQTDATCAGGTTPVCFADIACAYNGPEDLPGTFVNQVSNPDFGTGCGQTTDHGDIQLENFCLNATNPDRTPRFPLPPECAGLTVFRENTAITPHCGTNLGDDTVAVDDEFLDGDLPCGSRICIRVDDGIEKTVTDRCPACGLGRIDNFSEDGTCGIGDFSGGAQTIKLF